MPQSYIEYTNGLAETTFSVPFKYISVDDVHALGYDGTYYTSLTVASRSHSAKTITLATAPSAYTKVRVYRSTATEQLVDFQNGSRLSEADLDTAYQQGLFVAQEVSEDANTNQYTDLTDQALLAANTSLSEFSSSAHTGDGTATTFDLSFVPKTETPQAFLVIVDGILQSPVDAYTMSINPAQITFASAPPASSSIVVTTTAAATGTLVEDTDLEAGVRISIDPPADPKVGELWFDSSIMTMFAYYDDGQGNPQWVSISSSVASPEGGPVNVKDFGAKGDGVTDDTSAIQAALDSGAKSVFLSAGTYLLDTELTMSESQVLYGDGLFNTTLKRKNNSTNDKVIILSNYCKVKDLTIDGNKTNQTVVAYGILGYRKRDCTLESVRVLNQFGIGFGASDCANFKYYKCIADGCGDSKAGFFNDTYSTDSFYADGGHHYIECTSNNNELDGISIATKNNVIRGGAYNNNGYNGTYGGALGAAGIFTLDLESQLNLQIDSVECKDNSEFGINVGAKNVSIQGCICTNNQLAGIFLKQGDRIVVDSCVCANNGWYTGSLNPNTWLRGGIVIYPRVSYSIISNNSLYDDRGVNATQEYGIYFASAANGITETAVGLCIANNQSSFNKIDDDNINPSKYDIPSNLVDLKYDDFKNGEQWEETPTGVSATPSVKSSALLYLGSGGNTTITNLSDGIQGQVVRLFVINNIVTVTHGDIVLSGAVDAVLSSYMSNITLIYRGTKWYEVSRTIL